VGAVAEKRSRKGKTFFGCNRWPDCNFVLWDRPVMQPCPTCAKPINADDAFCARCGTALRTQVTP
jgi:ssDNA-binding Zn-finger/Zn-ribbon topoisomerase 1